jgi:hypothetical protein
MKVFKRQSLTHRQQFPFVSGIDRAKGFIDDAD